MSGGFGLMPWGLDEWGLGDSIIAPATFDRATPWSIREVDVVFTADVIATSRLGAGDALNVKTWSVERLDSLGATEHSYRVLGVTAVEGASVFRLLVLGEWGPWAQTHRVRAYGIVDLYGAPVTPFEQEFAGLAAAPDAVSTRQNTVWDLRNDPYTLGDGGTFGGVLQVSSAGDYATQSGPELLRKLIIRRLTTVPGAFFYLPAYGVGVRLKEQLRESDLATLHAHVKREVLAEPDVDRATVHLALGDDGVLAVVIAATMRSTSEVVSVEFTATA